ncbi:MAG: hypothetical protein L0H79_05690 [Intrasporangium sp.]|uniref:hypothetical protein n=1 Tax=Intrasporangium sp. TaxID=1925024 RepID=UPI002648B2C5|nr:hypothetical protein [Intrasporangium sp.]MDN5795229.1 hypothetical protein [Intrasporangium sp.]
MHTVLNAMDRHRREVLAALVGRVGGRRDRGDVPGWVLITLMTAGIVTVLWGVAGDRLVQMFSDALGSVSAPGR